MSFKTKLIILLLVVGTLPVAAVYFQYTQHNQTVRELLFDELSSEASVLSDIIDRHLFERLYDVQAFSLNLNGQAYSYPLSEDSHFAISNYFNQLTGFYQVYHRILLLSPDGQLLAANSHDAKGEPLGALTLDASAVSSSSWFVNALNVFSLSADSKEVSTIMAGPILNSVLFNDDRIEKSRDMVFAFPVLDDRGNVTAILANLMEFSVLEKIFSDFHQLLDSQGNHHDSLLLLDVGGTVLLDNGFPDRESIVGENWFEANLPLKNKNLSGQVGYMESLFPRTQEPHLVGYAISQGVYEFKGVGWSVLVSRPLSSAFARNAEVNKNVLWVVLGVIALMVLASVVFGRRLSRSLDFLSQAVLSLSKDKLDFPLPQYKVSSEVSSVLDSINVLRYQLIYKHKLEQKNNDQRRELLVKDAAIEMATTGIVIADALQADNPIIYANKAFYQMTGYSPDETLGQNCRFLQGQDIDQAALSRVRDALVEQLAVDVVLRNYRKNGEMFWNHLYISPVRNEHNQVTHYVAIQSDITQIKAYETEVRDLNLHLENRVRARTLALQQAENQLRTTFDTMIDALVVVDDIGNIQQLNRTTSSIFGFETDELVGQNLATLMAEVDVINDVERWFNSLQFDRAKPLKGLVETSAVNKQGQKFPVDLSVAAMNVSEQDCYTLVIRDISERKAAEIKLRKARDEAERANRIKSEFLGNMSHEIRTPMNAVIGMTDLVLETPLTKNQRHHLTTVSKSARSLLHLLNEILDLTKLERGSVEIENLTFDLRQLVQSVKAVVEVQADKKRLELTCLIDASVPRLVIGDPARLRQILLNLVGNAIKFTEQGQVNIKVTLDAERQNYLCFSVEDSGIGIAADRIEHIFNPFVQSDGSISRRYGGTGLGTTISRELVEKMGGEIWVESELGQGSCFYFTLNLPAAGKNAVMDFSKMQSHEKFRAVRPLTILLAEDVPANAELIQLRLGVEGHKIIWCQDGQQAVDTYLAAAKTFDLILMDIHMPNMNGYQAAEQICAYHNDNKSLCPPIIALTASGMEPDQEKSKNSGMEGFVVKPVEFHLLQAEMARLLPDFFEKIEESELTNDSNSSQIALAEYYRLEAVSKLIDLDKALANWGDEITFIKVLKKLPKQWQSIHSQLVDFIDDGRLEDAQFLLHRLKGEAGGLGMRQIYLSVQQCEKAINDQLPITKVYRLIAELAQQIMAVLKAIANISVTQVLSDSISQQSGDLTYLVESLASLKKILSRGMTDDNLLEQLQGMLHGHAPVSLVHQLIDNIDDFNFEDAIENIDSITDKLTFSMRHGEQ